MKNMSKMLADGNLTAYERIMLVIKNSAHIMKTGESLMDEIDMRAVSEQWKTTSNYEVQTYNKYLEVWKKFKILRQDMQSIFLRAQVEALESQKLISLLFHADEISYFEKPLRERVEGMGGKDSFEYILENTGLEYSELIHRETFSRLEKATQDNLKLLSQYPEDEHYWFGEELALAEIVIDKDVLEDTDIIEITNLILENMRWDDMELFEDDPVKRLRFVSKVSYGPIGYEYLWEQLLEREGVSFGEENMYEKLSELDNIKEKLRATIVSELRNGLLDKFIPLVLCDSRDTYSGVMTENVSSVFRKWLKMREIVVDELTDKGFRAVVKDISHEKFKLELEMIEGYSICTSKESYSFIDQYIKQVEKLRIYGHLFKSIKESDLEEFYGNLLAYREIVKKVEKVVNLELEWLYEQYMLTVEEYIKTQNLLLRGLVRKIQDESFDSKFYHHITSTFEKLEIKSEDIKVTMSESLEIFQEIATEELNFEWTNL